MSDRQNVTDREAVQILNEVLADYARLLGLPTDPTDTEAVLIAIEALATERDAAKARAEALWVAAKWMEESLVLIKCDLDARVIIDDMVALEHINTALEEARKLFAAEKGK